MKNNENNLLAVAVICQNEDGDILLRQRAKEPDPGKWQVIAGYVIPGETLEDSVRRLLKEKVNISQVISIKFTGKYYDNPQRHPGQFCIPLTFLVQVPNSQIKIVQTSSWFEPKLLSHLEFALDNKQMLLDAGIL